MKRSSELALGFSVVTEPNRHGPAVVRPYMDGEGFAVDASVMEADASRYHGKAPEEIVWAQPDRQTRAVREYLAALEAGAKPNPDRKPPKVISPSDPARPGPPRPTSV